MANRLAKAFGAVTLALSISACGGSDHSLASAPPPPPPPKIDDKSVDLLAPPAAPVLAVETRDAPIDIRYDAARNLYEVKVGAYDWSAVIDPPDPHDAQRNGPNKHFSISGVSNSQLYLVAHHGDPNPDRKYTYSNIVGWDAEGVPAGDWSNWAAIGAATPAAGIPLTGTAAYSGLAVGSADVPNDGWGKTATTPVEGKVDLTFDFGAGNLSGGMKLSSACDCTIRFDLPRFEFERTVFAAGSPTFSGQFATALPGANDFSGRFTGPNAQELIASWAMPFALVGNNHQATGVWIAKKGN